MIVWLINPYGPIPIPGEDWREYRFTMFGNYLSSLGHDVVWYTSSFSHHFKRQRCVGWKDVEVNSKFKIRLVPSPSYKYNISLRRIFRDFIFGLRVYAQRRVQLIGPDVIIYSESPLLFGYSGFKLAKHYKVPVVYDQMDLWPELMLNVFPLWTRKLMNIVFMPVFVNRRKIYNELDGFLSLAEPYLAIPMSIAPVLKSKPHFVIYNGIDVRKFRESQEINAALARVIPSKAKDDVWFVFAGTLGPSYDILNLLVVAGMFAKMGSKNLRIIIAGDGPLKFEVTKFVDSLDGQIITYLGQLPPDQLIDLYKICDVGLSTYTSVSNVEMPDKFYDYTAAGLPIINSLTGEVGKVIKEENLGINYRAGSSRDLFYSVNKLLTEDDLRSILASNSLKVGMKYDKNNQIRKLGNLLDEIGVQNKVN